MTATITLGKAGRLIVPKSTRDLLGLREGARLRLKTLAGKFEVTPEPAEVRIEMHEQELVNLRAGLRRAEAKESAAIDAMLAENMPFDGTSPIALEYCDFMRGLIATNRAKADRLENEIHEEEQWVGGYEEGAEDETKENYDPMDE
jgi:AbrB family looped-hinge helix DNA binding protein